MAELIYLLCTATSIACAALLLRGYGQSGMKLLLWSGICFVGLALNNVLLFLDLVIVPGVDLSIIRSVTALGAMMILLFGLVWESK